MRSGFLSSSRRTARTSAPSTVPFLDITMLRKLAPLADRVLVKRILPQTKVLQSNYTSPHDTCDLSLFSTARPPLASFSLRPRKPRPMRARFWRWVPASPRARECCCPSPFLWGIRFYYLSMEARPSRSARRKPSSSETMRFSPNTCLRN